MEKKGSGWVYLIKCRSHYKVGICLGYIRSRFAGYRAHNPVNMAHAFALAVQAGRDAFLGGVMQPQETAQASTPLIGTPFWHHD